MQTLHHILQLISVIIAILAIYTSIHRKTEFGNIYLLLLIAIFIYSFGYSFEIESTSIKDIYFWLRFQYIGISWLPTIYLILAIQYAGKSRYLKRWTIVLLISISCITQILQFTNCNNLFYTDLHINNSAPFPVADFKKGLWYWVHQVYSNITFLLSSIIYLNLVKSSSGLNKARSGLMFLSSIVPWLFYIIYLLGFSPYNIDLNPFSIAFVGILGALGIFRFHLLEFKPLALDSIFKNMSEGVIIIDTQKRLSLFNDRAEKIFPPINKKNIGINIVPILSEFLDADIFFSYKPNEPFDFLINNKDHTSYYQIKWSEINEKRNRIAGITIIISDITNQKEIEKKLEKNAIELRELNQNMTRFLTILGHDLRNPLNVLLNFSDIINSEIEGKVEEPIKEMSELLYETASSTCFLTENLLKWSQLLKEGIVYNPKPASINTIIEDELRLINTQKLRKKITITTQLAADTELSFDSDMIRTVLRNLVTNAIKFSHEEGEIQINTHLKEKELMVEVVDHGIGIREIAIKNIFQVENLIIKKGTAAETGSGLGLIVCKELITKHNGKIGVVSSPGKGSKFWFTIPA